MPGTRSQSRGPVGATAADERAALVENSTSSDPPAVSQGNRAEMLGIPNKLDDPNIILLRARVTKSRKDVDDTKIDVSDQVGIVKAVVERAAPKGTILRYKQSLKEVIEDGNQKLNVFLETNGELVEKLEALILVLTAAESPYLARATSLRDRVVGEAIQETASRT